jgi:hypothetical protein
VASALFDILETQKVLENKGRLTLFLDAGKNRFLAELLAADRGLPGEPHKPDHGQALAGPPSFPAIPR